MPIVGLKMELTTVNSAEWKLVRGPGVTYAHYRIEIAGYVATVVETVEGSKFDWRVTHQGLTIAYGEPTWPELAREQAEAAIRTHAEGAHADGHH